MDDAGLRDLSLCVRNALVVKFNPDSGNHVSHVSARGFFFKGAGKRFMNAIEWEDFEKVELCAGTIVEADDFPEAKKPAYKLIIDLVPTIGRKWSSAQITKLYAKEELLGKQGLCVVNFAPKKIGPFISEVLTTGFVLEEGVVLAVAERPIPNGTSLLRREI